MPRLGDAYPVSIVVRFWHHEGAATSIEYCFIAILIAMAIVGGATQLGLTLKSTFGKVTPGLN